MGDNGKPPTNFPSYNIQVTDTGSGWQLTFPDGKTISFPKDGGTKIGPADVTVEVDADGKSVITFKVKGTVTSPLPPQPKIPLQN